MCFNCDSKKTTTEKQGHARLQRDQLYDQGLPCPFWHIVKVVCSSVYQIQILCDGGFLRGGGFLIAVYHLLMATSSRIMHHVTKFKSSQTGFLNMKMSSLYSNGLHRHQISIQ